ncbi:hypothetical protein CEXT_312991 [Caerostris extrusa]|uniref:Uncharacterized protein n=1 Tax=Caerostris extrusa TaxID=172846 RepID=A0AAV4MBL0_CAEEX|nr:hypothetical protein CEXT_312991 [Caerostris extrusa]
MAANMLKIISAQQTTIAQLEGRLEELSKQKGEECKNRQSNLTPETTKTDKPTFANMAKNMADCQPQDSKRKLHKPGQDRHKESFAHQKDGIIIETVEETDFNKLIKELQNNQVIAKNYTIGKPLKRKPHFICYGVSEELTADSIKANMMHQCEIDQVNSSAISIVHSYKGPRRTNWIFEISPDLYKDFSLLKNSILTWKGSQ